MPHFTEQEEAELTEDVEGEQSEEEAWVSQMPRWYHSLGQPDATMVPQPGSARCHDGTTAWVSQMPRWYHSLGQPDATMVPQPGSARCHDGTTAWVSQMPRWYHILGQPDAMMVPQPGSARCHDAWVSQMPRWYHSLGQPDATMVPQPGSARCHDGTTAWVSQMPRWYHSLGQPDATMVPQPGSARCHDGTTSWVSQMPRWYHSLDDDDNTKEGPPGVHQTAGGASGLRPQASSTIHVSGESEPRPQASSMVHISGSQDSETGEQSDGATSGSAGWDAQLKGNGQKPLNGRGGAEGQTGTIQTPVLHFLHQLLGGANTKTSLADNAGSLMDSDVIGQWKGDPTSDQSPSSPDSERAHSTAQEDLPWSSLPGDQAGADWLHANGNGRQTQLRESQGVTLGELHTHSLPLAAAAGTIQSTSRFPVDRIVTGSSPVVELTQPADVGPAHTLHSGTQTWQTDMVTVATASVFSEATGTPLDSSAPQVTQDFHKAGAPQVTQDFHKAGAPQVTQDFHKAGAPQVTQDFHKAGAPQVTQDFHKAGSATEQYNPSGQGPEAAENMDLEDTC
ncbi:uncharacterized protein si:ch211-80h18.1 [Entelurus aequoreus]|uniref:uncharacterized protein si:ch211-80h18.1 n=1 Tax=Entelurus aequoreus TaxID=161455 RepID=UPI002B1E0D6A|nr:uncharacterized protein si:ch211-80h18.1 [Entelurus aequoreus]